MIDSPGVVMERMKRLPIAWLVLIFTIFIAAWTAVAGPCLGAGAASEAARGTLVFISDTQAPSFFETIALRREHNEKATQAIFNRVLQDKEAAAVFILGDITRASSNDSNWRRVDGFLAGLKKEGIPCYAAVGNHDYMWSSKNGLANFLKRFREPATWSAVTFGPAAVIILNSNFKEISPAEKASQQTFYETALRRYDEDPNIRGIIVCDHHPPYTNSRTVSPEKQVETDFVPPFLESKKGILFLSGHAHLAEHFVVRGKDFLVLGGGGGLRHKTFLPPQRPYVDIFPLQSESRPFGYLTVKLQEHGLVVTYEGLTQSLSAFESITLFTLPW